MESRPHFSPVSKELGALMESTTTLSPGTSCSPTSAALTSPVSRRNGADDFCTVDDDLGKHFFHDFYVAQLQYNVPTSDTIDFTCRYLHTFDYDLECHIRRYSSSKLRK